MFVLRRVPQTLPPPRGGRTERHGLSSPVPAVTSDTNWRAKSYGVPGGGALDTGGNDTPTRRVQWLRSAVGFLARLASADLSRGRIGRPPRGGGVTAAMMALLLIVTITPTLAVQPDEVLKD